MAPDRYLTSAIAGPVLGAAGLAALAALTGNPWFVLLAGACGGLVIASLASRHRLHDLAVCLDGPSRLAVGESVVHQMHVHNRGSDTSPALVVTIDTGWLTPVMVHVGRIPPGGRGVTDIVRTGTARGVADHVTVTLESSAPLGILGTRVTARFDRTLVVHPETVPPDRSLVARGLGAESVDPAPGLGLDVAGIRDWRSGDEQRRIHWRSTARRGSLVVVERGTGDVPLLCVAVVGPSAAPDWEPLLARAAASVRAAQLAGGDAAVTAWEPGGATTSPTAGSPTDLLDWWAALGAVTLPTPADFVATRGGHPTAQSLVVVASAHVPGSWWDQVRDGGAAAGLTVTGLAPPAGARIGR